MAPYQISLGETAPCRVQSERNGLLHGLSRGEMVPCTVLVLVKWPRAQCPSRCIGPLHGISPDKLAPQYGVRLAAVAYDDRRTGHRVVLLLK
jgi:hypothetical protein